jgi:hypothetical protein
MGKYYWIKERYNPQYGTCYVACGNTYTVKDAKKAESPLYGENIMHKFDTEEEYNKEIKRLKEAGEHVRP